MTCLQEEANGNYIVGNCHAGPDKQLQQTLRFYEMINC